MQICSDFDLQVQRKSIEISPYCFTRVLLTLEYYYCLKKWKKNTQVPYERKKMTSLQKKPPVSFLHGRFKLRRLFSVFSQLLWKEWEANNKRWAAIEKLFGRNETNNSLASWHVIARRRRGERGRRHLPRCQEFISVLPRKKSEPLRAGNPCVDWLPLLRRPYTGRCLQIWLPPAACDWTWGLGFCAPKTQQGKHKMAPAHRPF